MKKINVKSITEKLLPAATIAAGFAAAKIVPGLLSKVYKPAGGLSNIIVGGSEVVAGVLLSTMKNKHIANIGLGIAVSGLHTFIAKPVNDALDVAGLKGINCGYRNYLPNYSNLAGINCDGERNAVK